MKMIRDLPPRAQKHTFPFVLSSLCAVSLCLVVAAGAARDAAAEDKETVKAKGVVVTATRTEAELEDVPSSVTVITKEEIRAKAAEKLKDIIRFDSGITFTRTRGRDFPSIRGMDRRHTLILVDGKRLSGEAEGDFELDRITLEDVERIEIVKGPASALYGTDALGGVINIITKRPHKVTLEFTPHYGVFDGGGGEHKNLSAYLSSGTIGKFNFSLSGTYLSTNPHLTSRQTTLQGDMERKSLHLKAGYELDRYTTLIFDGAYLKEDNEERVRSATNVLQSDINDTYRYDLSLGVLRRTPDIEYFIRGYLSVYDKDYENRTLSTGRLNSFDPLQRTIPVAEAKITKELFRNHLVTAGGEYRHESFKGTRIQTGEGAFTEMREGVTAAGSEAKINYWAVYLQDEWAVSERLIVIPALRYDDSDTFESEVSPKLGVTFKILPGLRLKASYGHGFKSPTPSELYIAFRHAGARYLIAGNPALEPEKSDSYELAIEGERGIVSARLGYFYNDVQDLIESVEVVPAPAGTPAGWRAFAYDNIASAKIQGVEAELGLSLTRELFLKAGYTYVEAKDEERNRRLLMRPKHKIVTKLGYDNRTLGLKGTLWGEYIGNNLWQRAAGATPEIVKSYALWYLNVSKDITKNFELYAGADNVFNKKDEDIPLIGAFYFGGVRARF